MSGLRIAIGGVGVAVGAFGAWLLLTRQDLDQLLNAAIWLAVGVVLHDFVLAAITLLLGALVLRRLPGPARAPAVVGFVVLGSVTLLAVPVLGRFGARADNATLLDRDYAMGWLLLAALTLVAVLIATALRSRAAGDQPSDEPGGERGPGPRRR
ncbi:MAG: hypothetical protein WBP61_04665 [Nocardioides sp.]